MESSCEVAKLENVKTSPYFIIERVSTSDGVRTRICDGFYSTLAEAKKACDWKNRI